MRDPGSTPIPWSSNDELRDAFDVAEHVVARSLVCLRLPRTRTPSFVPLRCLLCRGFARLRCDGCAETRLVAFCCKGRGFCPSCLGRKMSATAANLVDYVMPKVALRQWVLTAPFAWRGRLGFDGQLLGVVVRKLSDAVLAFYRRRQASSDG